MKQLLLLLFLCSSVTGWCQKENNSSLLSTDDITKMTIAKQKLYAEEYGAALVKYKEVEKNNPYNSSVKYYIAFCQSHLGQQAAAKENLLKSIEYNKDFKYETYLLLAHILQSEEQFNEALQQLTIFDSLAKKTKTDQEVLDEAKHCRSQCTAARELMTHPLDVSITNLGKGINSKYEDKNPCITADGSKLVFTTRRPETTNSDRDIEGDGGYFENIYIVNRDSATHQFLIAVNAGMSINSLAHDACTSISPDGKQIFIYKNDASKAESRGGNVFVSKITGDKWKTPVSLGKPINSSYWEGGACVSADGNRYFFSSERPGGYGRSDIWMIEKKNKKEWNKPVNLGPEVNSAYDEAGMFLAPDGKTLFFCSNGPNSMGSYDVFKTVFENGKWTVPQNLGYPINTSSKEGQLTLSADARMAYISSDRKGGYGENDLYQIDLKEYGLLDNGQKNRTSNGLCILKGTLREGYEGYGMAETEVTLTNLESAQLNTSITNEAGEYFFTLPAGTYQLDIKKKGYNPVSEKIELPKGAKETPVIEKGYLLKKIN